jgi:putative transposase
MLTSRHQRMSMLPWASTSELLISQQIVTANPTPAPRSSSSAYATSCGGIACRPLAPGQPSAKRRLKKNAQKQRRFQANTNHCIAKHIVTKAKGTQRAIALEDLTGIKQRAEQTVRKAQRSRHGNWGFYQLRSFIEYKARRAGVVVELVDPRNTSRRCNGCGYTDKRNRKDQAHFQCLQCGHTAQADYNAACNIRDRAAVNQPMVSTRMGEAQAQQL